LSRCSQNYMTHQYSGYKFPDNYITMLAAVPAGRWVVMLGADRLGRDVLSCIIYGARVSLLVGVIATGIATVIGMAMGLAAGHFGGWINNVNSGGDAGRAGLQSGGRRLTRCLLPKVKGHTFTLRELRDSLSLSQQAGNPANIFDFFQSLYHPYHFVLVLQGYGIN
jgi:hypothetical protein